MVLEPQTFCFMNMIVLESLPLTHSCIFSLLQGFNMANREDHNCLPLRHNHKRPQRLQKHTACCLYLDPSSIGILCVRTWCLGQVTLVLGKQATALITQSTRIKMNQQDL